MSHKSTSGQQVSHPLLINSQLFKEHLLSDEVTFQETQDTYFVFVSNALQYPDACLTTIRYHHDTHWGNFEIVGSFGQSAVIHESADSPLRFKTLKVSGREMDINFLEVEASSINAVVIKGTIMFNQASVKEDSVLKSFNGDVIYQSPQDFGVFWRLQNSYYCLGVPQGAAIDVAKEPVECWLDRYNTTASRRFKPLDQGNCTASYALCAKTGCSNVPNITMWAVKGNIYANLLTPGTHSLSENVTTVMTAPFDIGLLQFEQSFGEQISALDELFSDRSKRDEMLLLKVGNYRGRSSSASKVAVSPNSAYVDMKPWWMSMLSASLLLDFPLEASGRFQPGFCPFRTSMNGAQLAQLLFTFQKTFSQPNQIVDIWNKGLGQVSDNFLDSPGYLPSNAKDQWTRARAFGDTLLVREANLSDNPVLMAALFISLALGLVLAILGVIAFIQGLYHLFVSFSLDSLHIQNYIRLTGPKITEMEKGFVFEDSKSKAAWVNIKTLPPTWWGKVKLTIKNLPPPFALIDHLVFMIHRSVRNSFKQYCETVFTRISKEEAENSNDAIPLALFKLQYERFCFLQKYDERLLTAQENLNMLYTYGFQIVRRMEGTQYLRIRFLSDAEERMKRQFREQKLATIRKKKKLKNIDTVGLFLQMNCVRTKFEVDTISMVEFKRRYQDFCLINRLPSVNIEPSLMSSYGIASLPLETSFLVRRDDQQRMLENNGKRLKYYNLNVQKAAEINDSIISKYLEQEGIKLSQQAQETLQRNNNFKEFWFLFDVLSVLFHLTTGFLFAFIPVIAVAASQSMRALYTTSAVRDILAYQDFVYTPWNIPSKLHTLRGYDKAILVSVAVYMILTLIELISYYLWLSFPIDTLQYFKPLKDLTQNKKLTQNKIKYNILRKVSQFIQWTYIFIFVSAFLWYFAILLVWSILAAVINPTAYLYYATAAATFVVYVGVKYTQLQDAQRRGWTNTLLILEKRARKLINNVVKRIILSFDSEDESSKALEATLAASASGNMKKLEEATVKYIYTTPLGKKMRRDDFDVKLVLRSIKGDSSAAQEFAREQKIPFSLIELIISNKTLKIGEARNHLKNILKNAPIFMVLDLVEIIECVKEDRSNKARLFTILAYSFNQIVEQKLQVRKINIKTIKTTFPFLMEAMMCVIRNEPEDFLTKFSEFNNAVKLTYRQHELTLSHFNSSSLQEIPIFPQALESPSYAPIDELFDENKEPKFLFPKYLLSVLKLSLLPQSDSLSESDIKDSLIEVLKSQYEVSGSAIQFLKLVFSNDERYDLQDGVTFQNSKIVQEFAKEKSLEPLLLNSAIKIAFRDRSIVTSFIEQLHQAMGATNIPVEKGRFQMQFIRIALGVFSIAFTQNVKFKLLSSAQHCELDKEAALSMMQFSSEFRFSLLLNTFEDNLAGSLTVSKPIFKGLVSILKGDLDYPNSITLVNLFCQKRNIPSSFAPFIRALYSMVHSQETKIVLEAIKTLNLHQYEPFILIGKNLLHPKYVQKEELESVVQRNRGILEERMDLPFNQASIFDWANRVAWSIRVDMKIKDEISEMRTQNSEFESEHHSEELKIPDLQFSPSKDKQMGVQMVSIRRFFSFNKAGNALLLSLVIKFLRFKKEYKTTEFISAIFNQWRKKQTAQPGSPSETQLQQIGQFLSLKPISSSKNKRSLKNTSFLLAELFALPQQPVWTLISLVGLNQDISDQDLQRAALSLSFNQIGSKKRYLSLFKFLKLMRQEIACSLDQSKAIEEISAVVGLPKCFISNQLMPYNRHLNRIGLNDVCFLFDLASFHDSYFIRRNLKIRHHNISLQSVKVMLANLFIGNLPSPAQIQNIFNIEYDLAKILSAISNSDKEQKLEIILNFLRIKFAELKIPQKVRETILALISILTADPEMNSFKLQGPSTGQRKMSNLFSLNASTYLAQLTGIPIAFFDAIILALNRNMKQSYEHLKQFRGPFEILPDILTVAQGSLTKTKFLEQKLQLSRDLIAVCILLARFSRNSHILQNIKSLEQSEQFGRFCREQVIVKPVFLNLLKLSSGQMRLNEVQEAYNIFHLYNHCEKKFIKAILTISQGSLTSQLFNDRDHELALRYRSKQVKELEKSISALCSPFGLPPTLAVIGTRLRQGDFQIIEDKKEYLSPFLQDEQARKLAMSFCGILRSPIQFNLHPAKYPRILSHSVNFEGSIHYLKDVFGINPLVFRLAFFDKQALEYVEKRFRIPSQVVIAFIKTLDNLTGEIIDMLLEKDLYRNAYEKVEKAKSKLSAKNKKEIRKRAKEEAKVERNKTTDLKVLGKEQKNLLRFTTQFRSEPLPNSRQTSVRQSSKISSSIGDSQNGNMAQFQDIEENSQYPAQEQEISSENLSERSEKQETSDEWHNEEDSEQEQNSSQIESEDEDSKEELKRNQNHQFDPMNTKYDRIDFRSKRYQYWYKQILQVANLTKDESFEEHPYQEDGVDGLDFLKGAPQLDPESEVLECVIFNTPQFASYDYDTLLKKGSKKREMGPKNKWEMALASSFLRNHNIAEAVKEMDFQRSGNPHRRSFKKLVQFSQYNWLRRGDRQSINNIWQIFKRLMKVISKDKKTMNSEAHGYERIQLSHFILANSLKKVRNIVQNEPNENEGEVTKFAQAVLHLEQIMTWVERNSIFSGRLGSSFHPNRLLKILGLALNLKFSNYFDYFKNWRAKLYDEENFFNFSQFRVKTEEELNFLTARIQEYFQNLRDKKMIHGMSLYEVEQFLLTPDRKDKYLDLFKSAYVADQRNVKEQWPKQIPRFEFQLSSWRKPAVSQGQQQLSKLLMIAPKEISKVQQMHRRASIDQANLNESFQFINEKVQHAYEEFQRFIIAQPEPFDLICGIAQNNQSVWTRYSDLLKIANIIKRESAIDVYKAFQGLVHLKSDTIKKVKIEEGDEERLSLKKIIEILAGNNGEEDSLMQNLLELAHGKIDESSLNILSQRFNTSPTVLRFFFLSAFLRSGITESKIIKILTPLADLLGTNSSVLMAITLNKHEKLWEMLVTEIKRQQAQNIAKEKRRLNTINKVDIIERIIGLVNWDKFNGNQGKIEVMDLKHSEIKILEIVDLIDRSKSANYSQNKSLKLLIKLAKQVMRNDLAKVLATVEKLGILLNRNLDSKSMAYFRALCLLTGNFKLNPKDKSSLIKEARKSIATKLSQHVVSVKSKTKITPAVQEMRRKAKGIVELLFGYKYKLKACEEAGAKAIGGKFLKIYSMFRNIQYFKQQGQNKDSEEFKSNFKMSLILLAKIIDSFIQQAKDSKFVLKLGESAQTQLQNLPVSRQWQTMDQLEESFQEMYKDYEVSLPPLQLTSALQSPVKGQSRLSFIPESKPQLFHIALLSTLMQGNVHSFLQLLTQRMQSNGFDGSGRIEASANLAHSTANIILMTKQQLARNVVYLFEGHLKLPRWRYFQEGFRRVRNSNEHKYLLEFTQYFSQLLNPNRVQREGDSEIVRQDPRERNSFLMKYAIFILLGLKFELLNEQFLPQINSYMLKSFIESDHCTPLARDSFKLLKSIVFDKEEQSGNNLLSLDDKLNNLVTLIVTQYYPDLQNAQRYLRILFKVLECIASGQKMLTPGSDGLKVLSDLLHVHPWLLVIVADLLEGDNEALVQLGSVYYLTDSNSLSSLIHSIEQVIMLLQEHEEEIELQKTQTIETKFREEQWKDLLSRIAVGKATYRDLFEAVDADGDQTGGISREEFKILLKRLKLPCSEHRVEEIFTRVKPDGEDGVDGIIGELDYEEFQEAMKFIEQKQAYLTLRLLGVSTRQLVWFFIGLTIILLLLFVFIFLGVQALSISGDGAFGSVINSLLPVGSGLVLMQQKKVDPEAEMNEAKDSINKVNEIVKTES